eukprot:COSAG01_NODE_9531_length_2417_cov_7.981717_2_plen_269_part_00
MTYSNDIPPPTVAAWAAEQSLNAAHLPGLAVTAVSQDSAYLHGDVHGDPPDALTSSSAGEILVRMQRPAPPSSQLLLLFSLLLLCWSCCWSCTCATVASVARQAIEFPEDIVLTRTATEPPFPQAAVKTCTVNREHGYSLLTPGFADGMPGVNFIKTPATFLNSSAVVCHLSRARNATGKPLTAPAITAGLSTVVVDLGGTPCDIALHKFCAPLFQKGPSCWSCARQQHGNETKAAGCDKGAYKAFVSLRMMCLSIHTCLPCSRRHSF